MCVYTHTHTSRCSDKSHFQLVFTFCIVIYYIILSGCPYIISCIVIHKLQSVIDMSNVTCVTEWTNKPNQYEVKNVHVNYYTDHTQKQPQQNSISYTIIHVSL